MKWLNPQPNPNPRPGQIRERFVWALWPTQVNDYCVWLERYAVTEVYTEVLDYEFELPVQRFRWVEQSRRTCEWYI